VLLEVLDPKSGTALKCMILMFRDISSPTYI